jgi:hypothetical protein
MSNEKEFESDGKTKKRENIKDIKDDDELKNELKEWEVESTQAAD